MIFVLREIFRRRVGDFPMHRVKDMLWTWLLPDVPVDTDREEWMKNGGKWIIFDRKERLEILGEKLGLFIDLDEIKSAKYWNKNPGAICVYSLDKDRTKVWKILKELGAGDKKVWEYDYAMDKNLRAPLTFFYSWFSKFSTILRSYGLAGTLQLIREILKRGNG
jgi:hypothetical protein